LDFCQGWQKFKGGNLKIIILLNLEINANRGTRIAPLYWKLFGKLIWTNLAFFSKSEQDG
jgi:hypothetical protein